MTDAVRIGGVGRRALLVLTRDPSGRLSGRKTVLATIARSVEACGFAVDVVVLSNTTPCPVWEGRRVVQVPLPGLVSIGAGAVTAATFRRRSLNEALFDSARVRRCVAEAAREFGSSVVIADTLRTAAPASATGLPVIVHLDDLLSDRYRAMAADTEPQDTVLGFFDGELPAPVRRCAAAVARHALGMETRLVARREVEIATMVAGVAITSPAEAEELARRSGRPVATLPMAVDVRPTADVAAAPGTSVVFVGLMSYAPNLAAVRWWRQHVRPALDRRGGEDIVLTVVGECGPEHRAGLADERLGFTGYVEDLAGELRRHRAMVAPVTRGTGLKTKVLDGLSVGLPVVATTLGVAGLTVTDEREAFVSDDPEGFADRVLRLRDDSALAARVGAAGRDLLAGTWSSSILREGWQRMLAGALPTEADQPEPQRRD